MRRREILISLGALALGVVLLTSLWDYLTDLTLHAHLLGEAPYNNPDKINRADKW